jgi:3-carboxy-cis,cis-muconate cycloisomerase
MATGGSFADLLAADSRVRAHLSAQAIRDLTDPAAYTGLCAAMADQQAEAARRVARDLTAFAAALDR